MKSYVGKNYTVYKHTNLINGKSYIGQTRREDLTRRWCGGHGYKASPYFYSAIKKYGWKNFSHEILFTNLTHEQANEKEREMIAYYKSNDPKYGYNIQEGGSENYTISEEGKQKLHDTFFGDRSPVAKTVMVYNIDGKFIASFGTVTDTANFIGCTVGSVSAVCSGDKGTIKGYRCFFKKDIGETTRLPKEILYPVCSMKKKFKTVSQYDLSGNYVQTFCSVKDASHITGVRRTEISSALSEGHRRLTAGGFQWRYGEAILEGIGPPKRKSNSGAAHYRSRRVVAYSLHDGLPSELFCSIKETAKCLGVSEETIRRTIRNHTPLNGLFLGYDASQT